MARTTNSDVQDLLAAGRNYNTVDSPSLTPFVSTANVIVTRVSSCATAKGLSLSSTELELIERWLAAHLYTQSNPLAKRKKNLQAEDEYVDRSFLDGAMAVDRSGCLKSIIKGKRASMSWLGLPPSEQTAYVDRD